MDVEQDLLENDVDLADNIGWTEEAREAALEARRHGAHAAKMSKQVALGKASHAEAAAAHDRAQAAYSNAEHVPGYASKAAHHAKMAAYHTGKVTHNSEEITALVANFIGKTRRVHSNGREFIVAPLSLIVSGVLNGSKGALYYPPEEVHRDPSVWNHVPIVVNHPSNNGTPVSARDPDVLANSGIGYVFKSVAKGGKLTAEGWFDIEHTKRIDNRILEALEAGRPIELSTGLFTDNEPQKGVHNESGKAYDFIARNYRPDHLAILPDQVGACSIQDGCGVMVNAASDQLDMSPDKACKIVKDGEVHGHPLSEAQRGMFGALCGKRSKSTNNLLTETEYGRLLIYNRDWPQSKREKLAESDFAGPHQSFPIQTQADVDAAAHLIGKADDPAAVKARIKAIAKRKGLKTPWDSETTSNSASNNKGRSMNETDKKKLIDGLITNCSCQANNIWSEEDREMLENMSDEKLQALAKQRNLVTTNSALVAGVAKELGLKEGELTLNAMPAAMKKKMAKKMGDEEPEGDECPATNADKFLENAPPEIREAIVNSQNIVAKEKARLIGQLIASLADDKKQVMIENLSNKSLKDLELLIELMPPAPKKEESTGPIVRSKSVGHFLGAGGPLTNLGYTPAEKKLDEEPFLAPTINYAEEAAKRSKSA